MVERVLQNGEMASAKRRKRSATTEPQAPRAGGRRPKSPSDVLLPMGTLRVTSEQQMLIRMAAKLKGLDVMTYARMRTLEAAQADVAAGRFRSSGGRAPEEDPS